MRSCITPRRVLAVVCAACAGFISCHLLRGSRAPWAVAAPRSGQHASVLGSSVGAAEFDHGPALATRQPKSNDPPMTHGTLRQRPMPPPPPPVPMTPRPPQQKQQKQQLRSGTESGTDAAVHRNPRSAVIGGCSDGKGLSVALNDLIPFSKSGSVFAASETVVAVGMEEGRKGVAEAQASFPDATFLIGRDRGKGLMNLAACRAAILRLAQQRRATWILMVDLDYKTNAKVDPDALDRVIRGRGSLDRQWHAATASADAGGRYYDWWAFRIDSDAKLNFDCWMSPRAGPPTRQDCHTFDIASKSYLSKLGTDPGSTFEVTSAYNGLALYHVPSVPAGCTYETAQTHHPNLPPPEIAYAGYPGLPDFNASYCEHVSFHRCLGRVVIHRSLRSPVIGGLH